MAPDYSPAKSNVKERYGTLKEHYKLQHQVPRTSGTRFIGVFLSRLLVKEGHSILHLKGDRKDFEFVRSSLTAKGFDVVYDINGGEANEVEPILDALPKQEQ